MTYQENTGNVRHLQPNDIKMLVQNQGRATIGENSFELKEPNHNDENLQSIVKNPQFTVKPMGGTPTKGGTCTYEISGGSGEKTVKVTVACK